MHIHFIAIAGTGMGALAGLLKRRGHEVTGSDLAVYPPMSTALADLRIPVWPGFRAEHVLERPPELVVIGNAVRADNPEARAAMDAGLPCTSFPDALFEHAISGHHAVVVTGTHGKTTTTSMVATLLFECGRDPSLLLGGISVDFEGNFRDGAGPEFVVEGDEYDTAFFDKTPKFLHYHPDTLVLTSVEFDHADIYRDITEVKAAFAKLVAGVPATGAIIAAAGSAVIDEVLADARCPLLRYGVNNADADLDARALRTDADGTHFELHISGVLTHPVHPFDRAKPLPEGLPHPAHPVDRAEPLPEALPEGLSQSAPPFDRDRGASRPAHPVDRAEPLPEVLPVFLPAFGRINVANALAALAVLHLRGVPLAEAATALRAWRGVKRRQELRGVAAGVTVIDDFAHHPTAVRETLLALRERFPGRRLLAVFEPRSNSSRRAIFQADYARAFDAADQVLLQQVDAAAPIYSAFGEVRERLDTARLADEITARGTPAAACKDVPEIVDQLAQLCRPGDVVITLSNGSFGGIWDKLLQRLG